ncbi:MAG: 50S ribosomal protein L5 [Nanoarchaeota archaeon]
MEENKMRQIKIEKVTLNIGVGEAGDKLNKAKKILEKLTDAKAVETITMKRIPAWGVRPKLPIGCKITLRGKKAEEILSRLFKAVDNKIDEKKFDNTGNLSFGIPEYIDIPNLEYDPSVGIIGLETAVTLERPGFRIKRKRIKKRKISHSHLISKEEAKEFIKSKFNVDVTREEVE